MPTYVKYRGAGKVPVTITGHRKDGKLELMPRKDWRNPGEKLPIVRDPSKVYHQKASIPARKKRK